MKGYTVRYAHLNEPSQWSIGSIIKRGDKLGTMGNTGSSTANHVHIDNVEGYQRILYHLADITFTRETIKQLGYFIDDELFGTPLVITSSFGDPTYKDRNDKWKMHAAFDVVPEDRYRTDDHFDIHWNRTPEGILLANDFDAGYGNYIMVGYEA